MHIIVPKLIRLNLNRELEKAAEILFEKQKKNIFLDFY